MVHVLNRRTEFKEWNRKATAMTFSVILKILDVEIIDTFRYNHLTTCCCYSLIYADGTAAAVAGPFWLCGAACRLAGSPEPAGAT